MSPILVIPSTTHTLLLSLRSTFPRHLPTVRGIHVVHVLSARACIFFPSPSLFFFSYHFESGIRGRNRKRHGRVSNRYSAALRRTQASHDATAENARVITRRGPARWPRRVAPRSVQSRECARFKFARASLPSGSMPPCKSAAHVCVQIVIRLFCGPEKRLQTRHTDFRAYTLDPIVGLG